MNAPVKTDPVIRVPAHLQGYVDALGIEGAVEFLLTFGGGVSYFSAAPNPQTPIAAAIGVEAATRLAGRIGTGSMRVPTGKPFIARYYRGKGMKTSAIARKLHVTDNAVRKWFDPDARQLTLFPLPPPTNPTP